MALSVLESIISVLRNKVDKLYYEDQDDYRMVVMDYKGSSYSLCLFRFCDKYIYGKLVELGSYDFHDCESIIYSIPTGLYVYARSIDEFLYKVIDKINWLRSRALSVHT